MIVLELPDEPVVRPSQLTTARSTGSAITGGGRFIRDYMGSQMRQRIKQPIYIAVATWPFLVIAAVHPLAAAEGQATPIVQALDVNDEPAPSDQIENGQNDRSRGDQIDQSSDMVSARTAEAKTSARDNATAVNDHAIAEPWPDGYKRESDPSDRRTKSVSHQHRGAKVEAALYQDEPPHGDPLWVSDLSADEDGWVGMGADPEPPRAESMSIPLEAIPQGEVVDGSQFADEACEECGSSYCCLLDNYPRLHAFGEYLLLEPGGVDIDFGQVMQSGSPGADPTGEVAEADPDDSSGFRVGVGWSPGPCATLRGTYTYFQSDEHDLVRVAPPNAIRSLVVAPNTPAVSSNSVAALAEYDIGFQLADVDLRIAACRRCALAVDFVIGGRYAHLEQDFHAVQAITPGTTLVASDITFDGGGIRFGAEAERKALCSGWLVYGRVFGNLVGGEYHASFEQFNTVSQTQASNRDEDDRLLPILEVDVGIGWANRRDTVRILAGYHLAWWFDTLTPGEYISAMHNSGDLDGAGETMTFDGLAARIELRR